MNSAQTTLETVIQDRMNAVYFDQRTRPDYYNLPTCTKDERNQLVLAYFKELLQDKPIIPQDQSFSAVSQERKLYGAFACYADALQEGYNVMFNHHNDSQMGQLIIDRLQKSTFHSQNYKYLDSAYSYILGVTPYEKIAAKYNDKTTTVLNGPLKTDVINAVKKMYGVI